MAAKVLVKTAPGQVSGQAPKTRKIQRYGWIPDLPDHRDLMFAAPPAVVAALPPKVDLRPQCPPVYDQGQLGSCTANAIAAAMQFDEKNAGNPDPTPSRLFIYYNERAIEGTIGTDSGAQLRDGIKSVATQGAPPETEWPYDIAAFTQQPPAPAVQDALKTRAIQYLSLPQVLSQFKGCLASGYPFVFGFSVYESFEGPDIAQTGVGTLPASTEQFLGGHAVLCVGYDDAAQTFLIRNSWGTTWGQAGYFTFPYAYLTEANLSSDFWTIRKIGA